MAVNWNPASPAAGGLEYRLTDGLWAAIARNPARALRMRSRQAATIVDAQFRVRDSGVDGPQYRALLEVFANGSQLVAPTTGIITAVCPPNADDTANSNIGVSAWNSTGSSDITNIFEYINEPVVWPVANQAALTVDSLIQEGVGINTYNFWLNTASVPATARILGIRSRAVGYSFTFGGTYSSRQMGFRLRHRPSATTFTPPGGSGFIVTGYSTLAEHDYGEINPVTGRPWTPADIAAFNGGDWTAQVTGSTASGGSAAVLVSYELLVTYLDPENRVAVGTWQRPATQGSAQVTTDSLVTMPAGTANWAKPSSGLFVAGLRIAHDTLTWPNAPATANARWLAGQARVDFTDDIEAPPGSEFEGEVFQLDSNGLYRTTGGPNGQLPSILFRAAAAAVDTDSQIYALNPDTDTANATAGCAEVTPTQTAGQRFSAPATAAYQTIAFPLECMTPTVDATISVQLRRVSDNVQFGGTFSITTAEFLALPAIEAGGNRRLLLAILPTGGSLVSGTTYEARVSVAGTGALWRIPIADGLGAGAAGFGGTTGCLVYNGGGSPVTVTTSDLPMTIAQQPPPPNTVQAFAARIPTGAGSLAFCTATAYEAVTITWAQPVVAGFTNMTIERYVDTGQATDTWQLVAVTDSVALQEWTDREVHYGLGHTYRLTNLVAGGGFSDPVVVGPVRPQSLGPYLVFTSNHDPSMTVVYGFEPQVPMDLLDFDADVVLPVDGADYHMVLMETERRGTAPTYRLIVNFGTQPCDEAGNPIGEAAVFQRLVDAVRTGGIPYVAVLDDAGNCNRAYVRLGNARREQPGWRYHVDATIFPMSGAVQPVSLPL